MNKKLISLLVAICLVIGLLPAVAVPHARAELGGALATNYVLQMAGYGTSSSDVRTLTLTNYDTPIYTKNTTRTGGHFIKDGTDYYADYITQSIVESDDDWNAKLIWHTGDEGPTLYLDGFKTDNYNEEYGTFRRRTSDYYHFHAGIFTDSTAPLKIVLQGEDSEIQAYGGINYRNKLTIESIGDTKLSMYVYKAGIMPRSAISAYEGSNGGSAVSAGDLIIDANLTINNVAGAINSGGVVTAKEGNIIFNGGTVELTAPSSGTYALRTLTSGDVIVNAGHVTADGGYRGVRLATTTSKIYVNGGYFYAQGSYSAVYAGGDGGDYKSYPSVPETGCYTIKAGTTTVATSRVSTAITIAYHTYTEHPANEPQPGVEGNTLYYSCSKCGKYFAEEYGKEIEKDSWIIDALPVATTEPTEAPTEATEEATVATGGALETPFEMRIHGTVYTLTNYDKAVYTKNIEKTNGLYVKAADSATGANEYDTYTTQTADGADESNWNAKLIWHTGDEGPTLYLNGFVIDDYHEGRSLWRRSTSGAKATSTVCGIFTPATAPLNIVLQGENSTMQVYGGIYYNDDLSITSQGDAMLTVYGFAAGIIPMDAYSGTSKNASPSGSSLTLNANLDVSNGSMTKSAYSNYVVKATGGDLTINGGNIRAYSRMSNKALSGIGVESGNLYIKGGNVYATSHNTRNFTSAAIMVGGDAVISGGTVEVVAEQTSGIRANNITVSGGTINLNVEYSGLVVNGAEGVITFTDGTVEGFCDNGKGVFAYLESNAHTFKMPVLGEGYTFTAGSSKETATVLTELAAYKYMKVTYKAEEPTSAPTTAPTSAPTTEATTLPTVPPTIEAPVFTAPSYAMTSPAVTTTKPTAPATAPTGGSTVKLWGEEVTIDTDDATADIPAAYYWVNGYNTGKPLAAEATDNWNISFQIIDNIPTVTLRDVKYNGPSSFLTATYNGCLKVVYEGTNDIVVPYSTSAARYFIYYASTDNGNGKGKFFLEGKENAVLNVTGGDDAVMMGFSNKVYLTIYGGTINMERTDSARHGVISAPYSKTIIQDCTLNVRNNLAKDDKHPAVVMGGTDSGKVTISNANVSIETNAHTGFCAGVFATNMRDEVNYPTTLTIQGNSNVKVVNTLDSATVKTLKYSGVGIYASNLIIKGGNVEAKGTVNGVNFSTASKVPSLADYTGLYKMYTTEGGEAVKEYTATPYFYVANTGESLDYRLTLQGTVYKVEMYDTPVYLINTKASALYNITKKAPVYEADGTTPATDPTTGEAKTQTVVDVSHTKDYDTQTTEGANEDNYNAKLVWHEGDEGPTLYLRDFIADDYNEELSKWKYSSATSTSALTTAGMHTGAKAPLKIVLEKGESVIKAYSGLQYQNQLTIESVGDASLTVWTGNVGIVPSNVGSQYVGNGFLSGHKLILNANLKVSQGNWSNAVHSGYIIRTIGADLIVNGGNIVTEYRGASGRSVIGIGVTKDADGVGGNLYINGGHAYSESYNSANHTGAAVDVAGNIYVTGGMIEAVAASQSGLKARNIYVTGGTVKTRVNYSSFLLPSVDGVISFTGGMLDCQSADLFSNNYVSATDDKTYRQDKEPVLKEGAQLQGWVGPNPYVLSEFAGEYKTYNKLAYEAVEPNEMPVPVPGGDIPLKTTVTIAGNGSSSIKLELKKYDTDVFYTVNKAVESVDTEGNTYTRWIQTTEGANENNWNAKFVWHSSDSAPTLYLNGFKVDYWNEETNKFDAVPSTTTPANNTAIATGSGTPMIIKLTGEDSLIEARFGIHYSNHLTILSDGDTKLKMVNQYSNITSVDASGYTLTVDANLDLYIRSLYNSTYSGGAIMNKGDIIIDGGTIVTDNGVENSKDVNGIVARGDGGNLTINGGNITVVGSNGQGHRNGAIQARGMLVINDGVVNASAKKAVGMNGYKGVEINGGEINVISPWYGITSGYSYRDDNDKLKHVLEPIHINGGTVTVMAERAFFSGTEVNIGEGMMAYAGAGKKNAEIYDGTDRKLITKPWFFATDDESKFIVIEEEEDEDIEDIITAPTAPNATDGTGVPGDSTGVPGVPGSTDATLPGGVTPDEEVPDEEIPEEEYWDSDIYVDYVEGDMDVIPDALIEIGLDSVDAIWEALLDMMWNVDEYINRVSFFDAVPWFYDGEEWIFADESHLPEDGYVTVVLPYPEGTDMDTEFTALHMFTTDTFGMTPGEVELLAPVNTEDGIVLELMGLSPVMLGWVDLNDTSDDNFATGDADVAVYFAMLLFSVLGMATVVLLNKKRAV